MLFPPEYCRHSSGRQAGVVTTSWLSLLMLMTGTLLHVVNTVDVNECDSTQRILCEQVCIKDAKSYHCECQAGYRLNRFDNRTCDEITECMDMSMPCSQFCESKRGSFRCACNTTYYELDADGKTCRRISNDPPPFMVIANRHYIRNLTLDGRHYSMLAKGFDNVVSLDFDWKENMLYFADIGTQQRLYRMSVLNIDPNVAPKTEILLKHNVYGMEGLAVDWIGRKLYYLNRQERQLRVCELNGTSCKTLLRNRFTQPRAIAVYPQRGFLFFTEWSLSPYVARMGLDGTQFEKLRTTDLGWPNALTIDYFSDKLFWGDAHLNEICYMDLDGRNYRHVAVRNGPHIFSLAILDDQVYWSDWNLKKVFRAHKFTGADETALESFIQLPNDIQIFHPLRQLPGVNPCGENNGGCSHLCLLSPGGSFKCHCPEYFTMQDDGKTCTANCSSNQFRCGAGDDRCIPKSWVCDRDKDCKDGSDEHSSCPAAICRPGEFQCTNHNCTRPFLVCDGNDDCGDKSDESDCGKVCDAYQFKCNSTGRCLPDRYRCDGDNDCGDGSDELPSICYHGQCTAEQFRCNNKKCIQKAFYCDNDDDCGDGSDEPRDLCNKLPCPRGWSRCASSYRCIPNWAYCNGHDDCRDGSDEDISRCPQCNPVGDFKCKASEKCVPKRWLCDGENDCGDNSDETDVSCGGTSRPCSESEFRCANGKCIRAKSVCDGQNDCSDASDERNCNQTQCPAGKQKCKDGTCIESDYFCDRRKDCPDASDESQCTTFARTCSPFEFECSTGVCITRRFLCDGDNDCGDRSDEDPNEFCLNTACQPPLKFRCQFSRVCLNVLRLCNGVRDCGPNDDSDETLPMCHVPGLCQPNQFKCSNHNCIPETSVCDLANDCGDNSDEIGCHHNRKSEQKCGTTNGGCEHTCIDLAGGGGYVCSCRPGFKPNSRDKKKCIDIDECTSYNNTCSQRCFNTKGGYECFCGKNYTDAVVVGGMKGKDCRAQGPPAEIFVASGEQIFQFNLAKPGPGTRTSIQATKGRVISIDYDPINKETYWIDSRQRKVFRSPIPNGNQTYAGQPLDINFDELGLFPRSVAVDYVGGNIYFTATTGPTSQRRKRNVAEGGGKIFVTKLDGRYRRELIESSLDRPAALAVDPALGYIFWTSVGENPKIERADMDGRQRQILVDEDIFFPTSLTIDYVKDHRLYWADPKKNRIESILPDRSDRRIILKADDVWKVDLFENWIYWITWHSGNLMVQDKFGRGSPKIIKSSLGEPSAISIYQQFKYNTSLIQDRKACDVLKCSHLCLLTSGISAICACPQGSSFISDDNRVCDASIEQAKPTECPTGHSGEMCQAAGPRQRPVSPQKPGVGSVLFPLFILALITAAVAGVAVFVYKKKLLMFRDKTSPGSVSFNANNSLSFSNPVLGQEAPVFADPNAGSATQRENPSSSHFTNPVYDYETQNGVKADTKRPASAIIAPSCISTASGADLKIRLKTNGRSLDPVDQETDKDNVMLVKEDLADV